MDLIKGSQIPQPENQMNGTALSRPEMAREISYRENAMMPPTGVIQQELIERAGLM